MPRKLLYFAVPLVLLIIVYWLGPSPDKPKFENALPVVPQESTALEQYIRDQEAKHHLKPDNEARIVWADSSQKKTAYSVVYLHGFGSCQEEGNPVHRKFAKDFGANLYLARLSDQGIDTVEEMINYTPDRVWKSAEEALAIGKALGNHVIVMSTSTGGTLALMLAGEFQPDVYGLINMSPNIAIKHPLGFLANNPWGLQIARMVMGGKYTIFTPKAGQDQALRQQYWYNRYRLESVSQLEELVEDKMTNATFKKVKQPSLSLYYYKDEENQDQTVSVKAIVKMNEELGTPADMKEAIAIPEAGDHVIGSSITSRDVPAVQSAIEKFAVEKLHLQKVN